MSNLVKRQFSLLKVLKQANPKLRRAIISNSSSELILALCEVIANVLSGTVTLSPADKRTLKRHKAVLRKIANKYIGLKHKRALIVQRGGFLPVLLGPALGLLATIIGSVV